MHLDAKTVLAVLGPLFLVLGLWRAMSARAVVPQARTWLMVGVIFSAVAAWLWWGAPSPPS
ncbi:MAG: hypothetical protein KF891_23530 [Rhizobacter sp.]|nr:hypothetical protein [Rhizobacter sp.]